MRTPKWVWWLMGLLIIGALGLVLAMFSETVGESIGISKYFPKL